MLLKSARMTNRSIFIVVALALSAITGMAQDKVAEGEYRMQIVTDKGEVQEKAITRWVLTSALPNGYHLESAYQIQPEGLRTVQLEELNDRLAPTSIGYALYRNHERQPGITTRCDYHDQRIVCGGTFEGKQVGASSPYKQRGPFWLWMEGIFTLDFPWLLDGTVNMAHLRKGAIDAPTVTVSGGTSVLIGDVVSVAKLRAVKGIADKLTVIAPDKPVEWEVYSDEKSVLKFEEKSTLEFSGTKIPVNHYTFENGGGPFHLWVPPSGILIKMSDEEATYVLMDYKQYKPLIPEIKVEN